jgi:hypothetical protein
MRHTYALPFFDFSREVRMGGQFWDFLGGEGPHEQLLAVELVGAEFAPEIRLFAIADISDAGEPYRRTGRRAGEYFGSILISVKEA